MRNMFTEGTVGISSPTIGGFRPIRMGQLNMSTMGPLDMPSINQGESKDKNQGAIPPMPIKPGPVPHSRPLDAPRARFEWAVGRLCTLMRRFGESPISDEVKSQIFWSYVKHSNSSEESVLAAYKTLCPEFQVPPKPVTREKELVSEGHEHEGFHGKTQITYDEAKELMTALDEVLKPLTPEEAAKSVDTQACIRDFAAGNFPKVEALRDDLKAFIDAGDKTATFEISKGDVVVAGKAIDCAVALGRGKIIKTALVTGGAIGAGALLLFLL